MDVSQSALDSLRTVEFRETLKGYHRDDVDEYLEKAAVEAEGLQEQLRQAGERLRQAGERIAELEAALDRRPEVEAVAPVIPDDTLQRTLLLAQRFVDETKADSEARAAKLLAEAQARAQALTAEAESKASQIASDSERRLREEINRLEGMRSQLTSDVETMARHLEGERNRLRSALTEVIKWVDDNVQPAAALAGQRPAPSGSPSRGEQPSPAPRPAAGPARNGPAPTGESPQVRRDDGLQPAGTPPSLPLQA